MWNDSDFNSTFATQGASKEIKKTNNIKYIVPVTCQTINLCQQIEGENSAFEYEHLKFHHIYIVGVIRSVVKRSNDITYFVDDMTSPSIKVKLQTDENEDGQMMDTAAHDENINSQTQFIENQYIKVYGVIKSLQGNKYIQAFKIVPIKELNDVTIHLLECINASIAHANKATNGGFGGASHTDANESINNYSINRPAQNPLKNSNVNGTFDNSGNTSGLQGLQAQISTAIKQCKSSEGLHINEICEYFKSTPKNKIMEALEFLSNEGHIYSTVDDDHYRSTDS